MKAIMLIAGPGTRLKPLTDYIPKCCLPVAGEPLLHIWLRKLKQSGVDNVFLNPSSRYFVYIMETSQNGHIPTITMKAEPEPLGTAGTIWHNKEWFDNEQFFIIYGDVLTDISLPQLLAAHEKHKDALLTIAAYRTDEPDQKGIITFDGDRRATSFEEKPENPQSDYAFSGIAVAECSIIEHLSKKDFDFSADVLPRLIDTGRVYVYYNPKTYYKDIGTIPDYLQCQFDWRAIRVEG